MVKSQNLKNAIKVKHLLNLDKSLPKLFDKGGELERVAWILPNGKIHRRFGPAIEYTNGDLRWYKDGDPHRDDDHAIKQTNGMNSYIFHGVLLETKEELENAVKTRDCARQGKLSGYKLESNDHTYYLNMRNQIHNDNGPAIVSVKFNHKWYFINGQNKTEGEFLTWKQNRKQK